MLTLLHQDFLHGALNRRSTKFSASFLTLHGKNKILGMRQTVMHESNINFSFPERLEIEFALFALT